MLDEQTIEAIAAELAEVRRTKQPMPLITRRYPEATVEDAYAVQSVWAGACGSPAGR